MLAENVINIFMARSPQSNCLRIRMRGLLTALVRLQEAEKICRSGQAQ
jgi:hypothetical protein